MTTSALLERPVAPLAAPSRESTATLARRECNKAIDSGSVPAVDVAVEFTMHCANQCLVENPTDPELREWHELLRDIAAGLEDERDDLATCLSTLAGRIYAAVRLATRNPVDVIADRPPARQLLDALYAMGDGAEQSAVRTRTGHSQSHFSNILSLLKGYGLVVSTTSPGSGRNRCLSLTEKGRNLLIAARETGKLPRDISAPAPEILPRLARAPAMAAEYQPPYPVKTFAHSW
jgi:DNA-binding MarR family transcriptional regulator